MNDDMLGAVFAYVDAHIRERISLSDVSEIAGYSPFYFSKLFSEAMGMPVTAYIRIRKLQHAVVSLLEGHKVLDVALMYAFDSHAGFTRAFSQLFGSTPSTVRRHLTSYTVPTYEAPKTNARRIAMETMNSDHLQRSMHQLVYEVLDNSINEAKAGYCTRIEVRLLDGNRARISDNGRGMPLSRDMRASKAVLDKILAGRPITGAEYSQMGDLAQAGLQAVNSLCEELRVTVTRDGRAYRQDYVRGVAQHDLLIEETTVRASGTEMTLKPDEAIFHGTAFSTEWICDWIGERLTDPQGLEITVYGAEE